MTKTRTTTIDHACLDDCNERDLFLLTSDAEVEIESIKHRNWNKLL